jgi:two-component system chemotaxis response regulator CheY
MAKNILICDDAAFMRMMIKDILTKNGYTVAGEAENGAKAVEKYNELKPDLVLMDITMPEMDGINALKKIKEKDPSASVIMCSAMGQQAMVIESIQAGAKDFIVKPFKAERLGKTLLRLQEFLIIHQKAELLHHTLGNDTIFIKDGTTQVKLSMHDIVYLEALKDYTGIITREKKYCVLTPLGNLLKEKAFQSFIRIHRSYAVQKHYIRKVTPKAVMVNNILLPVGRSYREMLDNLTNPDA